MIKHLYAFIQWDKFMHMRDGLFASVVVLLFMALSPATLLQMEVTAVLVAALIGLTKEGLDFHENEQAELRGDTPTHTVSGWDVFATTLGGVVVALLVYLLRGGA